MTWQEYQDAVCELYEQAEGIGRVQRDVRLPDRVTGQSRQLDGLLTVETKGHAIKIVLEAKFHEARLDVKDIESANALKEAVSADKVVIVAANGWSEPAQKYADHHAVDLRLFTIEDALESMVDDMWIMCPVCKKDCIVMNADGIVGVGNSWVWWIAGRCRDCMTARVHCQDCGTKVIIEPGYEYKCYCGYVWRNSVDALTFQPTADAEPLTISR